MKLRSFQSVNSDSIEYNIEFNALFSAYVIDLSLMCAFNHSQKEPIDRIELVQNINYNLRDGGFQQIDLYSFLSIYIIIEGLEKEGFLSSKEMTNSTDTSIKSIRYFTNTKGFIKVNSGGFYDELLDKYKELKQKKEAIDLSKIVAYLTIITGVFYFQQTLKGFLVKECFKVDILFALIIAFCSVKSAFILLKAYFSTKKP